MPRYTICASADHPEERQQVHAWLKRWAANLRYLSHNYGCGCCVDIYDVEGPAAAVAELPPHTLTRSDWTRS